jgi:hypothetical protein
MKIYDMNRSYDYKDMNDMMLTIWIDLILLCLLRVWLSMIRLFWYVNTVKWFSIMWSWCRSVNDCALKYFAPNSIFLILLHLIRCLKNCTRYALDRILYYVQPYVSNNEHYYFPTSQPTQYCRITVAESAVSVLAVSPISVEEGSYSDNLVEPGAEHYTEIDVRV